MLVKPRALRKALTDQLWGKIPDRTIRREAIQEHEEHSVDDDYARL